MMIRVSVVVPTYRRPDLLDRCLTALLSQDFDPQEYEILVVDDAASAETRRQVMDWAERTTHFALWPTPASTETHQANSSHRQPLTRETTSRTLVAVTLAPLPLLRYIPAEGEHGPAAARNNGWKAAAGEVIAFTDDDTIPAEDWLKTGLAAFSHGVSGVTGKVVLPIPENPSDYERDASALGRSVFVTANCFYLRSALEESGGFDSAFKMAWREDTDLYFRMLETERKLVCTPDAIVYHPIRPAKWGISLQQQKKSMYNALLYKKHPRLYREQVQPRPPWKYYLILLGAMLTISGAITGMTVLTLLGAFIWGGTSLWFIGQRLRFTSHSPGHIFEMAITSLAIPWLSVYWRTRGAIRFRVWFF